MAPSLPDTLPAVGQERGSPSCADSRSECQGTQRPREVTYHFIQSSPHSEVEFEEQADDEGSPVLYHATLSCWRNVDLLQDPSAGITQHVVIPEPRSKIKKLKKNVVIKLKKRKKKRM